MCRSGFKFFYPPKSCNLGGVLKEAHVEYLEKNYKMIVILVFRLMWHQKGF